MKSNEDTIKTNLDLIGSMVENGATDKEIAKKIGIGYSTYRKYKAQNADLKQVIAEGKDKKNQAVEQALYKCCIGYSYYEEVPTKVKTQTLAQDGTVLESESVSISSIKKYKGPDLQAQKYWLNNKEKAKWKEDHTKSPMIKNFLNLKRRKLSQRLWICNACIC